MKHLTLRLFGQIQILLDEATEVRAPGKKAYALLAYLALNANGWHTREKLATLLWGDRGEEQARHSLRQAVLALRKSLGDSDGIILKSDDDRLALDAAAIEVDIREFEELAAKSTREALESAVDLYSGELLEGLSVRSQEFDDWLAEERVRLRNLAVDTLRRLVIIDHGDSPIPCGHPR